MQSGKLCVTRRAETKGGNIREGNQRSRPLISRLQTEKAGEIIAAEDSTRTRVELVN